MIELYFSAMSSIVWQHFQKTKEKGKAKCLKCPKILSCKGSSTSSLLNHLKNIHKISIEAEDRPSSSQTDPIVTPNPPIKTFLKKTTLGQVLAQCVAEDGISVNALQNSKMARSYLKSLNLEMPSSNTTIWKLIYEFYEQKKVEYIELFKKKKAKNEKFSIVVDEWTDHSNFKYLNVSIRCLDTSSQNLEVFIVFILIFVLTTNYSLYLFRFSI